MFTKTLSTFFLLLLVSGTRAEVINIDNAELARLMAKGVPIIDIRTEGEWKNTGVIAGSKLLTFFDERGNAAPAQWLEKAKAVGGPDKSLILICRSGNRTRAATQFLSEQAGYRTVYNVTNGIGAWVREGRPLVPAGQAK